MAMVAKALHRGFGDSPHMHAATVTNSSKYPVMLTRIKDKHQAYKDQKSRTRTRTRLARTRTRINITANIGALPYYVRRI